MSYHKTTLFYEMQITQLLENWGEINRSELKEKLEGMLLNPDSKEFDQWFENNKINNYVSK